MRCRRYWLGLVPVAFLKADANLLGSSYPTIAAISDIGNVVCRSSSAALSMRRAKCYRCGGSPVDSRNARQK